MLLPALADEGSLTLGETLYMTSAEVNPLVIDHFA